MQALPEYLILILGAIASIFAILSWHKLRHPMGTDVERLLRDELRTAREESSRQARDLREEIAGAQSKAQEMLSKSIDAIGDDQQEHLDRIQKSFSEAGDALRNEIAKLTDRTSDGLRLGQTQLDGKLELFRKTIEERLVKGDEGQQRRADQTIQLLQRLSEVIRADLTSQREAISSQMLGIQKANEERFEKVRTTLDERLRELGDDQRKHLLELLTSTEAKLEQIRNSTETRLKAGEEAHQRLGEGAVTAIRSLGEALQLEMTGLRDRIHLQLQEIQRVSEERSEKVRVTLDEKLKMVGEEQRKQSDAMVLALKSFESSHHEEQQKARNTLDEKFRQIQESNERKLDEMRTTVDEKLHSTLELRLGESFKLVSERLEAVQRGLGEMQSLATGVGDLKRVLGNVKERGTWGEYQLGNILAEILTPEQYARNVRTKDGRETVEFAIKLPGRGGEREQHVWLPIDAKFPKDAYEKLIESSRLGDAEGVHVATAELARAITKMARDIQERYINPPVSTDFAILFLPTEGLYAEVLRQPGLHDDIQRKHRVLVAGPTTLSAILSSLRVGFQTLAIEKRASEVWTVLGAVKTEFGKFGDVLDKVKKQISTVSNTLDESTRRTRAMERKLRTVEQLPSDTAQAILSLSSAELAFDPDAEGD